MDSSSPHLLSGLLRDVSRSFYLTLRVLPAPVREQIGLAYLLARATDTIADTRMAPLAQRMELLERIRHRLLRGNPAPVPLHEPSGRRDEPASPWNPIRNPKANGDSQARPSECHGPGPGGNEWDALQQLSAHQASPGEAMLLRRFEELWLAVERFSEEDRRLIHEVLKIITLGQASDLARFGAADREHIAALKTDDELEEYTFRVAGCVGLFWTKMCRRHLFPRAPLDEAALLDEAVRFGKGLQLVNILRDLPADLRAGRCYLPSDRLHQFGLHPQDLLAKETEPRLRPLYDTYLERAESHLAAGWEYTNRLPYRCARVRLACAWPLLIGKRTLDKLKASNVLDARERIKVSRQQVRHIVLRTLLWYPFPPRWRKLFPKATGHDV